MVFVIQLQMSIEADTKDLSEMVEYGDSVARVDILLKEATMFKKQSTVSFLFKMS